MEPHPNELGAAVSHLAAVVSVLAPNPSPPSHESVTVAGLCTEQSITSLGVVLVGFLAQAVTLDLEIQASLGVAQRPQAAFWLRKAVYRVVGKDNDPTNPSNPDELTERNPWIAEGVVHVLALLEKQHVLGALPSGIVAHSPPPVSVKNPGIDMLSLHLDQASGVLRMCVVETKASENDGETQVAKAIRFLSSVDNGDHELELRFFLSGIIGHLDPGTRAQVPEMVMRESFYLSPAVAHWRHSVFNSSRDRRFDELTDPVGRVRLFAIPICPWSDFFDGVAEAMRAAVEIFEGS